MKIIVTGGAGFIGSHIVDAYINAGHDVTVIDDLSSGIAENVNPKARLHRLDICDESILSLFQKEKFDILNHHAAQIDVRVSVREPKHDAMVNIIGSLNLYEAAAAGGVRKIIFASSAGTVYGEQNVDVCDEQQPTHPVSPYGVAKLANEHYLYALKISHNIDSVILRYSNVFGPRQSPHGEAGVIAIFLHKMLRGEQPVINGDGLQTRDYTFIADIVRSNLLALRDDVSGVFNISSARERNVLDILGALNSATGLHVPAVHVPQKAGEQSRGCYSFHKALKEIGWQPEVQFEEGIRRLVELSRK